jgi:NitT/TauT family transport system ATP-binding protein
MANSTRPFLSLRAIRKTFAAAGGTTVALNGVDLEIERGSFVSVIGSSGCGKSTLLQIMAGLIEPTSGNVMIEGCKVDGPPRNVIYVFQQYTRSLFPWKTVERNVAFGLENREQLSNEAIAARTQEYISLVKLTGFERHYPWQLSGGMQQRVAIAQALVMKPKILLMDEAFSALDPGTRAGMQRLIRQVWRETGTTVLFVTHNIAEAVHLATRVIVLAKGRDSQENGSGIALDLPVPDAGDRVSTSQFDQEFAPVIEQIEQATGHCLSQEEEETA